MAKIKICGLKRKEDISFVNELKPDYIGFILSNGYKRSIDMEILRNLRDRLSKDIKTVGVFVDEDIEIVNMLIKMNLIDIVQLHGSETVRYIKQIDAPVIKMLRPDDFDKISEFEPYVDYFLFDSGAGSGKTFDWGMIVKTQKPFFLAGGLDENNLEKAIKEINPYCVDLSSAVETDEVKDYDKMKTIIDIVRSIDNE